MSRTRTAKPGLQEYWTKRDFGRTPEPRGQKPRSDAGRLYVIQKHAAQQLHYDMRLEIGGVLVSWVLPKGPSLDPSEKRLAVQVEDHPVEYGDFEGTIPEGEYGGGTVMVWDRGDWEPLEDPDEGLRQGKLKFRLDGQKLTGGWALVRIGGPSLEDRGGNWLLIKAKDADARPKAEYDVTAAAPDSAATGRTLDAIAKDKKAVRKPRPKPLQKAAPKPRANKTVKPARIGRGLDPSQLDDARPAEQPEAIKPQLATLVKRVPEGDEWLHETKYDGYRMICMVRNGQAKLISRNGKEWSARFPRIVEAVGQLPIQRAVLDGEVAVVDEHGLTSFQRLQNVMSEKDPPLVYFIFDLPYFEGYDLTRTPLLQRKQLLEKLLAKSAGGPLRYSEHTRGRGAEAFERTCRFAAEGLVSKRIDSTYEQFRTFSWVKAKCVGRQEFVVGGYTNPKGSRTAFGSLLVGYYEGLKLVYCGRVGTGFSAESLTQLHDRLSRVEQRKSPFDKPPRGREAQGAHWVRPEIVVEVEFGGWTDDGILRHPSFEGVRDDRAPQEVHLEVAEPAAQPADTPESSGDAVVAGARISNPDRVLYPEQGITKRQLAEYYVAVADWMLPHVADRPLTLLRCPQGRAGECFFQKHISEKTAGPIHAVAVREKSRQQNYASIRDVAGLLALVQLGVLEVHVWGSRNDDLEHPDRIIFDLDPGPDVEWSDVVAAGLDLRKRLEDLGLRGFAKTSGGKGLHVVVPIRPKPSWDDVKDFAEAMARRMAQDTPDRYIATASKARRTGKIFIDYLRNARGATHVAPYSTRARAAAPVSTPVDWAELTDIAGAAEFSIASVIQRLKSAKRDPWAEISKVRQTLTATMRRTL